MKKITLTALTLIGSLAFMNCSSDDNKGSNQDCVDCKFMGTSIKYCHTEGDDFYTISGAGTNTKVPLDGIKWSEAKAGLLELCD